MLLALMPTMLIPLVKKRNTIKLLKRIRNLAPRRRQSRVQRHTLHLPAVQAKTLINPTCARTSQVYAPALFDVAEIYRVNPATLVGDDGRF